LSVLYFLPPLEASNLSFSWHAFADPVPSIIAVLLDHLGQDEILHLGPDHLLVRRSALPLIELVGTSTFNFFGTISSFVNRVNFFYVNQLA